MDHYSGEKVNVSDVSAPSAPTAAMEKLVAYLTTAFPARMELSRQLRAKAGGLTAKYEIVELGFESLDFKSELDGWLAFAERILDEQRGDQFDNAQAEKNGTAKAEGTRAPAAEIVKARANQHLAPIKEAVTVMKNARDTATNTLMWCQSLQKSIRDEEFGSLYEDGHEIPDRFWHSPVGTGFAKTVASGSGQS